MKKIWKRENKGISERFIVANLNGCIDDEMDLLREFNTIKIHSIMVLFQRNPIRLDENTFQEEHLRLEGEYEGSLLRIFACNNIDEYIKTMDFAQTNMKTKEEDISEIIDSLKEIPQLNIKRINVLNDKKDKGEQ